MNDCNCLKNISLAEFNHLKVSLNTISGNYFLFEDFSEITEKPQQNNRYNIVPVVV